MIRKENMSAAIFAPGWVHETQDIKEFTKNQNRLIYLFCYTFFQYLVESSMFKVVLRISTLDHLFTIKEE